MLNLSIILNRSHQVLDWLNVIVKYFSVFSLIFMKVGMRIMIMFDLYVTNAFISFLM